MIATSPIQLAEIMGALVNYREPVAIDTETTGLRIEPGGDQLRGFSVAVGDRSWYVPVTHPDSINADFPLAAQVVARVAMHNVVCMWNSPFDRLVLHYAFGVEFSDTQVRDGMLVDFLIHESADHRLKWVGARTFGIEAKAEKEALDALFKGRSVGECYGDLRLAYLNEHNLWRLPAGVSKGLMEQARAEAEASRRNWETVTAEELGPYAAQDTRLTLDLYWWQESYLTDNPEYREGLDRAHRVLGVAYRMRRQGVRVNKVEAQRQMDECLDRIEELSQAWPGVNLRSAKQVQALVYDTWGLPCTRKTKAGGRSTDKRALTALAYDPRVRDLMEFRKLTKRVSALYVPLLNKTADDGRVHASFNAYRARTGRWSSSGPNLQQIERGKGAQLFEPADGMRLWSCDLPQAEPRVAACLAQEPLWLDAFLTGDDLYMVTAGPVGVSRQVGKVMLLQLLYGSGAPKLAETLTLATGDEWTPQTTRPKVNAFWRAVPRVKRLMQGLGEAWIRNGRLPIKPWPGRFRHRMDERTGFPEPEYKALNSIIQGTVGELVNDWCIEVERRLEVLGDTAWLVMQVHDCLVIEAPASWTQADVEHLFVSAWKTINPFGQIPWPLEVHEGVH